jgi:MazG family protein
MALVTESAGARFEQLLEIMRRLRAPDGCPWDREQTHASLRPFVLEETYEVLEAIERGSPAELCEELGDFLFEAVFLARLSEEAGDFSIGDALKAVCSKLVRRHPHVFARAEGSSPLSSHEVVERWETLKAREREAAGLAPARPRTTLSGVPRTLPSLLRAYEVSSRAATVGFDWARAVDVLDKSRKDCRTSAGCRGPRPTRQRRPKRVGDRSSRSPTSRKLDRTRGGARQATEKFTRRFEAVEQVFAARGRALATTSLEEMEAEWNRVKQSSS